MLSKDDVEARELLIAVVLAQEVKDDVRRTAGRVMTVLLLASLTIAAASVRRSRPDDPPLRMRAG